MCGILGCFYFENNKNNEANNDILNMFQDQRKRGTEGFGIINIKEDGDYKIKRSTNEIKATVDLYMEKSPMIIMHHRQPTSTENKINQTHPIVVDNKNLKHKYLVIHNGMITNDKEMEEKHEKLGYKYTTKTEIDKKFNDSECLAIEAARYIEEQIKEIETLGSATFIAAQIDKETNKIIKIYFGRNSNNPLKLSVTRGRIKLSSEGQGELVEENTLYNFDLKDFKIKKSELKFKTTSYKSNLHWREDRWDEQDEIREYNEGFQKNTLPKNLPLGYEFETTDIEEEVDYELTMEKETEEFTEGMTGIVEQFVEDLKDEREIYMLEPKEYMQTILKEMYKIKEKMEKLHTDKIMNEKEIKA